MNKWRDPTIQTDQEPEPIKGQDKSEPLWMLAGLAIVGIFTIIVITGWT